MALTPGDRLGPYEIVTPLGAGGMGEVYRARDTRLGREVAIKVLPRHLSSSPEVRARFEREARTVSSLNHPHICTLHDIGRDGEIDFLVLELVDGETLAARLSRGALPVTENLKIGIEVADALNRAHRSGVVHRDLKPGNVMLTKSGAKLMDFGLARAAAPRGDVSGVSRTESPTVAQPLTAEGTLVGTFQYMSPEQLEGKEADARSDLWALGCVLYEMATGRRAFEGGSQASLIAAILEHEPAPIPSVQPLSPPALDRLVRACLAKDPDDRVQSAQDVKLQLEWIRAGEAEPARPVRARSPRVSRLRHWAPALLATVLVAAAFVAGRRTAPPEDSGQLRFERKTYGPEPIFTARFMPDGKTLVLSAAREGNRTRLFVIRPEYPEPQPIGPEDVHLLAVSSRGELAVLSHARYTGHHRLFGGTLARMPLEGGAPREIMEDVREADWSPDGASLAVIHEVGGKDRLEFPIGTVLYESSGYLSDLRVSPRGDRIAFMEHPVKFDDRGSVGVVDLAGHARVLSDGYWGMEGMAWSRDGSGVFFSASTNGGDYSVYEVDLEGHARQTRQNVGLVTIHDVAADGTWAVTRDELPSRVALRRPGSAEDLDLSWLDSALDPILSGDGRTIVFTDQSLDAGPTYQVTLRPAAGGAIVRLGEGTATQFSPDGKSVLVVVYSTPQRLMAYPLGVGAAVRLDRGTLQNISGAHWMPDGHRVLVDGNETGGPPRSFLLDPASGRMEPVGPEGIWESLPSPDGASFIARSQTGWAVYPTSVPGEGRAVPSMTSKDYVIRWSPDGSAVYCFGRAEIPSAVERVDVVSGRRETVTILGDRNQEGLVSILSVSMADDRRTMVYAAWNYTSVLYTVHRTP